MAGGGETIFALATTRGRAGIAVIRLSGAATGAAVAAIAGRLPAARDATLATFRDPGTGEAIDRGLVLWFPGPGSFTGEDVAEFHLHGGPAVVAGMLAALGSRPGCRHAEAGEFTRRAFLNGKLDLSAAEGIADLVDAETAAQRRQALTQAGGVFDRLTQGWTRRLTRALAHLEAAIDFPDEEIPLDLVAPVLREAAVLSGEIGAHLADGHRGERLRDGLSVALIGPPNSGKSSLLNRLAGRDAAIVAATAGTTRDVVEVHLDLGGYPVLLADTAGIRETQDEIEAEGVRRATARAKAADLTVLVIDAAEPVSRETFPVDPARSLLVWNKVDRAPPGEGGIAVSAKTGAGIDRLIAALAARADELLAGPPSVVTRERHRAALSDAVGALDRAASGAETALIAEDLRLAVRSLGRITGRVDVEDLLDVIFREFCIGK